MNHDPSSQILLLGWSKGKISDTIVKKISEISFWDKLGYFLLDNGLFTSSQKNVIMQVFSSLGHLISCKNPSILGDI